jgi:uncharacterized membrane protein YfcA
MGPTVTTLVAAVALGLLVGVVVGGFGGGGGVLSVPLLVYALGQSAQDATTGSILIVGATAIAGVLARCRCGGVDQRIGLAFIAVGVPSAWLGTLLNRHASQPVLLLAFAGLTVVAAVALLLNSRDGDSEPHRDGDEPDGIGGVASVDVRGRTSRRAATAAKIVVSGAVVGFLTGFLGVGGGFLVVPALVLVLRMPMTQAVGTSLLIIVGNSVASLGSRFGALHLDWGIIAPFALAAIVGTVVGKQIADRLSGALLTRSFAVMLVAVGLFVAVESVAAF